MSDRRHALKLLPVNYDARDNEDNDNGEGGDGDKADHMDDAVVGDNTADDRMVTAVSLVVTQLLQVRRGRWWRDEHEVRRWLHTATVLCCLSQCSLLTEQRADCWDSGHSFTPLWSFVHSLHYSDGRGARGQETVASTLLPAPSSHNNVFITTTGAQ